MSRRGMWTCALVVSVGVGMVAAPQTLAVTSVSAVEIYGHLDVGMTDWDQDAHDVTIEPNGLVLPGYPRSLTITDKSVRLEYWPLDPDHPDCEVLSAHKVKCISDLGIPGFTAALQGTDKDVSFLALPGPLGPATTIPYSVATGSGDDTITVPVADQTGVDSGAGDDTVVAPSGSVYCGPGNDTAVGADQGSPEPPFDCETFVPL